MFAVVTHLDQETEQVIFDLWKGLSKRSISNYAEEVWNRKPHITLADYSDMDESFIRAFESFYGTKNRVKIVFNSLSTFIKTGTLVLTPAPSREFIELHAEHHRRFNRYSNPQSLYLPNKWTPHCTISNRLTQDKLTEAFQYCTQHLTDFIHSEIVRISVIQLDYQNNRATGVSVISDVDL
jgi:2'-5' RNA ligase